MGVWDDWGSTASGQPQGVGAASPVVSPKRRPPRRRMPRFVRRALAAAAVLTLLAGAALSMLLINYTIRFPDPMSLRKNDATPIVRVLARDGSVLAERGQNYQFLPLDLLPHHVIEAVVATEDRRFFDHRGLDPIGLFRAMFANLRAGRYVQGGSTLSQQLAKNLFLSSERTMGRKFEELMLAIWLEVRLPKQDILELYLNRVYFGGGAYGIEAAARRYFAKSARSLTLAEAAVLAGLLKAPSKYSPNSSPGLARARSRVVLKKMLAAGYIEEAAESAASAQSVKFADPTGGRELTGLEYAVEFVLERLPPLIGTGHKEIIIETTFDAALQKQAQSTVQSILAAEGSAVGAGQAAMVILDTDGGIRAMIGGRSWAESQFNRAIKAHRQPGSAFKPLVYLAAVEQGATPDTMVLDMPLNINGWTPRNENGQNRGAMTMRQALAHSVNTVAARLQQDVGTKKVIATARRLGIKSELRPSPSLSLGASEVSLIELTGAYGVFASGGVAVEPHAVTRVRTNSKTILYERSKVQPRIIVAPDHIGIMSSMLNTAMVSGTGRRAVLTGHMAAGKTGTTQDFRDAWFVGYTAHLAGGVWVGNDTGETMSKVMGGGLPATIWRAVMQGAHEKLPPAPLPGMQKPWTGDTLRDTDRHVRPIDRISDLLAHDTVAGAVTSRATGRTTRPEKAAVAAAPAKAGQRVASAHTRLKPRAKVPKTPDRSINPELATKTPSEPSVVKQAKSTSPPDPSDPAAVTGNDLGGGTPTATSQASAASELDRLVKSIGEPPQKGFMGLGAQR